MVKFYLHLFIICNPISDFLQHHATTQLVSPVIHQPTEFRSAVEKMG